MSADASRKVLYSPGFGAGWASWNDDRMADAMLFDRDLIAAVESRAPLGDEDDPTTPLGAFAARMAELFGADEHVCLLGARDLRVAEVYGPFRVDEYDGSESIMLRDAMRWH